MEKHQKRWLLWTKEPLVLPDGPTMTWTMGFMGDSLVHGRRTRTFNIIDDFNGKAIAVEADFSFAAMGVAQVPKRTIGEHGRPESVRVHHGPEFHCAFSACRHNKANREIHERLTKKGKSKKLALIAVSNKLLKQAFAIVESG